MFTPLKSPKVLVPVETMLPDTLMPLPLMSIRCAPAVVIPTVPALGKYTPVVRSSEKV
jgi:hypothetical protein